MQLHVFTRLCALQERQLKEAQAASRDRAEAVAAEMDAMRENALAAALAEARHSLAALQRQHEAGQRSLAELQVPYQFIKPVCNLQVFVM